jgi:ABC-type sugar transport system substrate-binding protein
VRISPGRSNGKRSVTLGAVIVLVTLVAAALGSGAGASPRAKKPVNIALFVAIQSNPVEQAIINNFQAVAKKDGAAKFVVFDSNNSVQKEIANCNDAIAAKKYDAFALKAVAGPPLMGCARQALKAGIPVVAFGNTLGPNPNTEKRQIPGLSGSVIELARINGVSAASLTNLACKAKKANPCRPGQPGVQGEAGDPVQRHLHLRPACVRLGFDLAEVLHAGREGEVPQHQDRCDRALQL